MNEINLWLVIYDLIKWLVIYIKRDWQQLFKKNFILIRHILLSINTLGILSHETVAGTKNAGADEKKTKKTGDVYVNVLFLNITNFCNEIISYNNCIK